MLHIVYLIAFFNSKIGKKKSSRRVCPRLDLRAPTIVAGALRTASASAGVAVVSSVVDCRSDALPGFRQLYHIVAVHILEHHLSDVAQRHLTFQLLRQLILLSALGTILLVRFVGVEPGRDSSLTNGKLLLLGELLLGSRTLIRMLKLGQSDSTT